MNIMGRIYVSQPPRAQQKTPSRRPRGDKVESDSIQNQKGIIEQHIRYLQGQGEQVASVEVYSAGYSHRS